MLALRINQASETIIVTLNELVSINDPYFLFIFTHVETKQVVSFIKSSADDSSSHQYRYNEFSIATATVFANKPVGEWHYEVYQQASSSNTNPDLSDGLLEKGKMILSPATEFEYEMYNEATTYKAYNG